MKEQKKTIEDIDKKIKEIEQSMKNIHKYGNITFGNSDYSEWYESKRNEIDMLLIEKKKLQTEAGIPKKFVPSFSMDFETGEKKGC